MLKFLNRLNIALALTMTVVAVVAAVAVGGLPAAVCGVSAGILWTLCD